MEVTTTTTPSVTTKAIGMLIMSALGVTWIACSFDLLNPLVSLGCLGLVGIVLAAVSYKIPFVDGLMAFWIGSISFFGIFLVELYYYYDKYTHTFPFL